MALGFIRPVLDGLHWLSSLGVIGQCCYVVGLTIWTLLCLPTTPIEVTAGFCFDTAKSAIMSAGGKTMGNLAALMIGRRYFQPYIMRNFSRRDGGSALHQHLLNELREHPIQTSALNQRCVASKWHADVDHTNATMRAIALTCAGTAL